MSDDFGTVNLKPRSAERSREIEVMRQRYRRHQEALTGMAADAPTEHLAAEYARLLQEVNAAFAKLDDLERVGPTDTQPMKTAPGTRPLVTGPSTSVPADDEPASAQSRIILIVIAGLLVLSVIGWMLWKATSDERPATPIAETAETVPVEVPIATPAPVAALAIEPSLHDYGVVRKGTRATRQFEVANSTGDPIRIKVARSACRCLYYDYAPVIPAKGKETLTVTVDGGKAEAGDLREAVQVSTETDPSVVATFDVSATIR